MSIVKKKTTEIRKHRVKKTIYLFSVVSCLCGKAFASYIGNPALPRIPEEGVIISKEAYLSLATGYVADFVFGKSLTNSGIMAATYEERLQGYAYLGSQHRNHHHTSSHFAWALGVKGIAYQIKMTDIAVDLKYAQTTGHKELLTAIGASQIVGPFVPYLGGYYSYLHRKHPFGLYFGFGLTPGKAFVINFEGRVIDESAISLSGVLRF